jgi:hypothetical protein
MYCIINKKTNRVTIVKETTQTADFIGVSRETIYYWFKQCNHKETDNYIIYKANDLKLTSKRGRKSFI